jgi:protein-S-isoprenylcysteine O-methyltransferase Ste14
MLMNISQDVFNWIWIVLFVVIVVVRKIHERKAGERSSLKDTPAIEGTLMMLWGLASGVLPFFYIFSTWLGFANFPYTVSPLFGILGAVLFLLSIWLLHRSHVDLGKLWSPTVEPEAKQRLVTDGVFKRIRHPMYSAHMLWGVAQALLLTNYIAGPLALVLMLAVIVLRVPREEQAMIEEFGDEYRKYMQKTGRIFPKFGA